MQYKSCKSQIKIENMMLAYTCHCVIIFAFTVFLSILIVNGNPVLFGLATGGILSVILFLRPVLTIWLIIIFGLLFAGVVPIWAHDMASKSTWGISVLGFMLMIAVSLNALMRRVSLRHTPPFIWGSLLFILYVTINGLVQFYAPYEFLSGFKRYFQVTGLLFAMAWLPISQRNIHNWLHFFVVVVLIQLPWAIFELVKLVPIREGIRRIYPNLVPIDVVAGTFGSNLYTGGADAEMATFLIISMAFLLSRWRSNILTSSKLLFLLPFTVAPLLLGETKVVIVLLPLMVLVLYRKELLVRPIYAASIIICGLMITMLAGYMYLIMNQSSADDMFSDTLRYNFYDRGYGVYSLNRTTTLTFWAKQQGTHGPASLIFGNGIGSAHDGTIGHLVKLYPGYGLSLTGASILLWEQGLFGIGLFLIIIALAWNSAKKVRYSFSDAWVHADAAAIQASLPLFLFYLVYRPALFETLTFQIVFYMLLGYLAWLCRYCTFSKVLKK